MSGSVDVERVWNGEILSDALTRGSQVGLATWAMDVVERDKELSAYDTGRLQRSKRTAPPSYQGNDTAEATNRDLAASSVEQVLAQMEDGQIAIGSYIDYAYVAETRQPATLRAIDEFTDLLGEYVVEAVDRSSGGE